MTLAGRPWIQTASGRAWCADAPREYQYDIGEIAHALSNIGRFNGHSRVFYSVGEHSVRVSAYLEKRWPPGSDNGMLLAALTHDAAEAFAGDMVSPLKAMPEMAPYRRLIGDVEMAIAERFGLGMWINDRRIREADLAMLAAERRDLLGDALSEYWQGLPAPACEAIVPWSPAKARAEFLAAWRRYGGA